MFKWAASTAFVFILFATMSMHSSAADAIYTGLFGDTAVGGYDTVSYFEKGEPEKGRKKYKHSFANVIWLFNSEQHLNLFKATPEKYMPQYGGFCAWAVAVKKVRASGDPLFWTIVDNKLYLNYDKNVQQDWLKDASGHIQKGDVNWPLMLGSSEN